MGRGLRLAGDDLEESRAVAFELGRADAGDARHLVEALRPGLGHLDQRAVGEDDVGRHARGLGQRAALGLQRRQKRRVLLRHQRLGGGAAAALGQRVACAA
jgi:hypothetical protein